MKKNSWLPLLFLAASSLAQQHNTASFGFTDKDGIYDFGTIKEGVQVVHRFLFRNTGDTPLQIQCVTAGSGSVVAEWPEEPVLPGRSAAIKVTFGSLGQSGAVHHSVQVRSITGEIRSLVLQGKVLPHE